MTLSISTTLKNAALNAMEQQMLADHDELYLRIYTGTPPTITSNPTGTLLVDCLLPADPMSVASSGSKQKAGTWEDTSADATGTAGYFRLVGRTNFPVTTDTCHIQGTVTATGGGGDMEVTSTSFTAGQKFVVTTFTLTAG